MWQNFASVLAFPIRRIIARKIKINEIQSWTLSKYWKSWLVKKLVWKFTPHTRNGTLVPFDSIDEVPKKVQKLWEEDPSKIKRLKMARWEHDTHLFVLGNVSENLVRWMSRIRRIHIWKIENIYKKKMDKYFSKYYIIFREIFNKFCFKNLWMKKKLILLEK